MVLMRFYYSKTHVETKEVVDFRSIFECTPTNVVHLRKNRIVLFVDSRKLPAFFLWNGSLSRIPFSVLRRNLKY